MSESQNKSFFIAEADRVRLELSVKDRVKILLRRKGLSQNELADLCGLSKGSMSQIVNEKWAPSSETMLKISKELDCDSIVIFGDTNYWKLWRDKMLYMGDEK